MFVASLLPPNVAISVRVCNSQLDQRAGQALVSAHTTVGVLRGSMAGVHTATVQSVYSAYMHQCLLHPDERHAMLIANVRGNSYTKDVPLAVLALPPPQAALAPTLSAEDASLVDGVVHALFKATSQFERGELCVVPLRHGGWSWAVVACEPELVEYPCYLNRDIVHPQRILTVSLIDAHANWRHKRKRLPVYFAGKLPGKYHHTPFAKDARRNWNSRAANLPPVSSSSAISAVAVSSSSTSAVAATSNASTALPLTSSAATMPPPPLTSSSSSSHMPPPPSRPVLPKTAPSGPFSHVNFRPGGQLPVRQLSAAIQLQRSQHQQQSHQQHQQPQVLPHQHGQLPHPRDLHQPRSQQPPPVQQPSRPGMLPVRQSSSVPDSRKRPVPSFAQPEAPPAQRTRVPPPLLPTPAQQVGTTIPLFAQQPQPQLPTPHVHYARGAPGRGGFRSSHHQ